MCEPQSEPADDRRPPLPTKLVHYPNDARPSCDMPRLIAKTLLAQAPIFAPRPARIPAVDRVVPDERVEVDPTVQANRILGHETAEGWVKVSRTIIVQLRLGVVFPPGKLESIRDRAAGVPLETPEGLVAVLIVDRHARTGARQQSEDVPGVVLEVVIRTISAVVAEHARDVIGLRVVGIPRHAIAERVEFREQRIAIPQTPAGAGRGRLSHPPAPPVVAEPDAADQGA